MPTVELEAGEFHYVGYGDRAAPPLVLLHGMPSDGSTWDAAVAELAARYWVTTPDQALGLDRFILGGHSMGGTVATLFAERYPGRPDATLVTIEGAGHAVHRNRPAEFLDAVLPFVQRIRVHGTSPDPHISRIPRGW